MRFSILHLFSSLVAANVGDILVDFDPNMEGRVGVYYKVEEVISHVQVVAQSSPRLAPASNNQPLDAIDARSLLGRHGDLDAFAGQVKRQQCQSGYGYCSNIGGCCPLQDKCCEYDYCLESGRVCCPGGSCPSGYDCCGADNCSPSNGECCSDGKYCTAGNICVRDYEDDYNIVCCTDLKCTAVVEDNGSTSYATTSTSTRTYTTTSTQYYYWTVTWWYWYYYWSYDTNDVSIVTSSQYTTTSYYSVLTTDAAAASSYFSALSKTIVLPTPSSAVSLESLAGSTFASASVTGGNSANGGPPGGDGGGISVNGAPNGGNGVGNSAARGVWSQLDGFTIGFSALSVVVGLIAALL